MATVSIPIGLLMSSFDNILSINPSLGSGDRPWFLRHYGKGANQAAGVWKDASREI